MGEVIVGSSLIKKDGKFLLIKGKRGAPRGLWNNPGGHKDKNESIEDTAKRETKEETGFNVEIGRLIGIYIFNEIKKSVYEAKIVGGELKIPPDEIDEAKWFSVEEVKELKNITFGAMQSVIDYSNQKFNQVFNINRIP